jgi:hypothetical protein
MILGSRDRLHAFQESIRVYPNFRARAELGPLSDAMHQLALQYCENVPSLQIGQDVKANYCTSIEYEGRVLDLRHFTVKIK